MFATYPQHKVPLQYPGDPSTTWNTVELVLDHPFFLCTIEVEGFSQRFFLARQGDVIEVARQTTEKRLTAIDLVVPPEWSEVGLWEVLPVKLVMQRQQIQPGEPSAGLVLITQEGATYAGHPLERIANLDTSSLTLVADFVVRGMCAG